MEESKEIKFDIPQEFNLAEHLVDRNISAGRGDKVAIYFKEEELTYNHLASQVNRAGNVFLNLGVEMENRVALILLDAPPLFACFLGAIKMGAVPIPISTMLRSQDYEYILNDSRARVLVIDEPLLSEVGLILGRLRFLRNVVVVGKPPRGCLSYQDLMERASDRLERTPTSKDDQAFWQYSSGSTGFPKGVVHLQHDAIYCCETYYKYILGMNSEDRVFSAAKLFFAYGLGNSLYAPLNVGASIVLHDGRPLPEKMFEIMDRYRPTIFFSVPTIYASMLAIKDAEKRYDTSSLRLCVSAGEALPAEFFNQWKERFGTEILDGMGTTEVCHIFISNRPGEVKPGSTGKAVPGYEIKLVDEEGNEVKKGEIGDLMVKADSIAAFYWNKHDRTKATFFGPWIKTGDKMYQDEEGYYWYCGRSDDMLKVGGIWVSPVEVENTLVGHPAVLEAAVVGAPDEEGLIKPKAFVILKEGYEPGPALEEELKKFVKDRIAPYKYPRWIEFVPELPKTATGKMQRFRLRGG